MPWTRGTLACGLWLGPVTALLLLGGVARAQSDATIITPRGGETWEIGSRRQVQWAIGSGGNVRIELSRDGGATWEVLVSNSPNDGIEEVGVDGPATTQCRVRVTLLASPVVQAVSEAEFAIVDPIAEFTVTGPNGGDIWVVGSQQLITWSGTGPGDVRIELSRDGGVVFETLFDRTRNDGAELWTVTDPVSGSCVVRLTNLDDPSVTDDSDATFFITATQGLHVLEPDGGEVWTVGTRQVIRWAGFAGGRVMIELSRDGGSLWETLFANTPDDGIQSWVVDGAATTAAVVRVTRLTPPLVGDVSDLPFTISVAPITVITPQGGENWVVGTQKLIRWSSVGGGTVGVDLSRDGGVTWEILFATTPNDGAQFWTVTGPPTAQALVRVTSLEDPTITDISNAVLTISRGTLALVQPNGGERWPIGLAQPIRWATTTGGSVRIDLSRDDGSSWETLFENTPNDGNEAWKVTGPACTACRMRIVSWQDSTLRDQVDDDFALYCAPVTLPIAPGEARPGELTAADCESSHRAGAKARLYSLQMPQTGLVTIDLSATAFDAYVLLLGPDGSVIAENDNGGGGSNARLDTVELPGGGPYTIEVTSAAPGALGSYTVTLQRYDIELLGPIGGEVWKLGERRVINWRSGAPSAPVDITVFRSGDPRLGAEAIATATANDGDEPWIVLGPATAEAVFQVCIPYGSRGTKVCDTSGPVSLEACAVSTSRSCYSGPDQTLGVGQCRVGTQRCGADGVFAACENETLPQTEVCGDGLDQDCNGSDLACVVCPGVTTCADDDPCSTDACVDAKCRHDLPPGWGLFDCRRVSLGEALAGIEGSCRGDGLATERRRQIRRLERLAAAVERLAGKARAARARTRCVSQLAGARQKAGRLARRVEAIAGRAILCEASAQMIARRVQAMNAAIVALSSCDQGPSE